MPDVVIAGPEGRLEGRYQPGPKSDSPIAIMLHPHPQHGGTMNNKVVYHLYHTFVGKGFATLRFNFRGVGRSQGRFGRNEGELSDAASALDWMQGHNANASACWIAGFSFGAWIGMQLLMRRPEITGFISVAPPANLYDFTFLAPCPTSGLILLGNEDQLVPEEPVAKLAEKLTNQRGLDIDYRVIKGADHFFTDKTDDMIKHVDGYLTQAMAESADAESAAS